MSGDIDDILSLCDELDEFIDPAMKTLMMGSDSEAKERQYEQYCGLAGENGRDNQIDGIGATTFEYVAKEDCRPFAFALSFPCYSKTGSELYGDIFIESAWYERRPDENITLVHGPVPAMVFLYEMDGRLQRPVYWRVLKKGNKLKVRVSNCSSSPVRVDIWIRARVIAP